MNSKHILFFAFSSLVLLGVNGCAQKMVKQDSVMPESSTQAKQQQNENQASSGTTPDTAVSQDNATTSKVAKNSQMQKTGINDPKTQPPASKKDKDVSGKDAAAAIALLSLPPKKIMETINKLENHPRTLFLSKSDQYEYYVGGMVDAKYDINKNRLIVTNALTKANKPVTCKYSKDGDMISGKKTLPSQTIDECNKLINELNTYMVR